MLNNIHVKSKFQLSKKYWKCCILDKWCPCTSRVILCIGLTILDQLVLIQFIAQNVLWSSHKSIKFWTFFKPNVSKLHGIIGWMSSIWAYLKNPWVVMALFGFEECIQNDRLAFSVSERERQRHTHTNTHTGTDRQYC